MNMRFCEADCAQLADWELCSADGDDIIFVCGTHLLWGAHEFASPHFSVSPILSTIPRPPTWHEVAAALEVELASTIHTLRRRTFDGVGADLRRPSDAKVQSGLESAASAIGAYREWVNEVVAVAEDLEIFRDNPTSKETAQ